MDNMSAADRKAFVAGAVAGWIVERLTMPDYTNLAVKRAYALNMTFVEFREAFEHPYVKEALGGCTVPVMELKLRCLSDLLKPLT